MTYSPSLVEISYLEERVINPMLEEGKIELDSDPPKSEYTLLNILPTLLMIAAMGFLFHWKRFWVYMLTHLASLVIAGILLILGAFAFKSPMPVALGYGALQAGLYLLAAVGFNVKGGKTTEMEGINHA